MKCTVAWQVSFAMRLHGRYDGHAGERPVRALARGLQKQAHPRPSPSVKQENAPNKPRKHTVMQFRNNPQAPDAVIPILYRVAQEWKARFQENPKTVEIAMRQSVFLSMNLLARLQKLQSTPASLEAARARGWLTPEGHWTFLTWNSKLQKHEIQGGQTISQEAMIQQVQECITWAKEEHDLTRFSPTRPIEAEMTVELVTYLCESLARSGSTAAHRPAPAAPSSATFTVGPTGSREVLRQLRLLRLHNPDHYCYMHAVVHALCWTNVCGTGTERPAYGRHTGAFKILLTPGKSSPLTLMRLLPWQVLLRGWHHEGRQHDAHEFLLYLANILRVDWMQQSWQARRQAPELRVMDTGTVCAIPLEVPTTPQIHLQECVEGWHQQASVHALTGDPAIVVLHSLRGCIALPIHTWWQQPPYTWDLISCPGTIAVFCSKLRGSSGDLGSRKTASLRPKQQRPTKRKQDSSYLIWLIRAEIPYRSLAL